MKARKSFSLLLIIVAVFFSAGCSSFESVVQSVENTFGKRQPEIDTATLDEAKAAYQSGNIILAEERYKEYIEANQRSGDKVSLSEANSQLGRIAFEKRDFQASSRYFDEAIKLDPDNLEARGLYGESLYWQKEYHRAEPLFRQALQVAPNDRRFQIMLGLTLAQQKQYQVGLRYLKQALGEQGAYEEISHIYNSHYEFEKATLAISKARESYDKQQQLVARTSGGTSTLPHAGQQGTALQHAAQFPTAQAQPYQPVILPQQQLSNIPQVGRQQQNADPRLIPIQQQYVIQQPMQQYTAQQPVQYYPQQQPHIMPNAPHSYHQSHQPLQNYDATHGIMNPAIQPEQYPAISQPQQVQQPQPQWSQDNRPPQGFAAMGQQPPASAPASGPQTMPPPFQQNNREIAYHPSYSDPYPGVMQPGTMYPVTPSPTNPLAERAVSTAQPPTPSPDHPTMPMTGYQNNQAHYPVFYGYQ